MLGLWLGASAAGIIGLWRDREVPNDAAAAAGRCHSAAGHEMRNRCAMRDKINGWVAVVVLAAAGAIMAVFLTVTSLPLDVAKELRRFRYVHDNPNVVLTVVSALALIATVLGFLAFKTFQGKYSCIGGLILFLVGAGMLLMRLA
jgi:hypothetical protein